MKQHHKTNAKNTDSEQTNTEATESIKSTKSVDCSIWGQQPSPTKHNTVIVETPIAIIFNGISHAVMMATPDNLHDFALGFCITESILDDPHQLLGSEIVHNKTGIELHLEISNKYFSKLKAQRRTLIGRTGCGLCGVEALEQATPNLNAVTNQNQITHQALQAGLKNLSQMQPLNQLTGAVHAAAWCNNRGDIKLIREDVGRHNALDKMIGALIKTGRNEKGFALITSRASYEMIMKAARADIGIMAAISAPTSLAIELAQKCGIGLAAFTRPNRHTIYSHCERFQEDL